jgi:hypothetical protein
MCDEIQIQIPIVPNNCKEKVRALLHTKKLACNEDL